jgi:hypothetical protein
MDKITDCATFESLGDVVAGIVMRESRRRAVMSLIKHRPLIAGESGLVARRDLICFPGSVSSNLTPAFNFNAGQFGRFMVYHAVEFRTPLQF